MKQLTRHDVLSQQISELEEACPPIEAFGVGGSDSENSPGALSDIDFFLFLPTDRFLDLVATFPWGIGHPVTPVARAPLSFLPDFGFKYAFVLPAGLTVEYFLNCRETLSKHPMRLRTRVVHDTTGYYTDFLAGLPDSQQLTSDEQTARAANEFLLECLLVRKFAARRQPLPLIYRLDRLRLVLLGLEELSSSGYFSPHGADRRDVGIEERLLLDTVPTASERSILTCYRKLHGLCIERLEALKPNKALTPEFFFLANQTLEDVVAVFREETKA